MLVPVAAAALALAAALAGYVMVKFYGVMFLGQPREESLARRMMPGLCERVGLLWLAAGCVLLGLFAGDVIALIDPVTAHARRASAWAAQRPPAGCCSRRSAPTRASYSPLLFLLA